jgi:hypothetical protein
MKISEALAALERLKDDGFALSLLWSSCETCCWRTASLTDHAGTDGGGAEPGSELPLRLDGWPTATTLQRPARTG